ncbi:hypothetical protein AMJ80_11600 [bacterium SM23_31]|nr:MAG: hypothetical protein AMJ80_11600 [bacterium SM23_31]
MLVIGGCSEPETYVRTEVEIPVKITEVTRKRIEETTIATGTVTATVDILVKSEIEGAYNLQINPRTGKKYGVGDAVMKDEVTVLLENPEQENKIRFDSQKLSLENAEENLKQQQMLYEKGGVSLSELKSAQQKLIDAQYSFQSTLMQLEQFKVKVPFDGIIASLPYYPPKFMAPANSDMFQLMDYRTLHLEVNLPGKMMGVVREGMMVRVTSYLLPDKVLPATIAHVAPVLEPNTRTFGILIEVDNSGLVLKPGMFVKAEIITQSRPNAIVIPKDIIMVRRTEKTVYVVTEGVAQQRRITTGLENQDEAEVIDGLEENEFLVIEGFETLRNGAQVTITR